MVVVKPLLQHFDCNYGAMHVPLDWLFGTYAGCKEEVTTLTLALALTLTLTLVLTLTLRQRQK